MPTIAAYSYKHSIGQPFIYPRNALDYASNFLHMMFATPCEEYDGRPGVAKALDLLLILHADHEQNCSTSTVRMVGSSNANLFASIAAGISALWGPLHGGANQEVIEMLERIEPREATRRRFVARAKAKNDNSRLMGFGHRVYKNFDPRAVIMKKACVDVLKHLGVTSRMLEIAMQLEEIALKDEYFISRKLYPNVDFYSGIIYKALGIPVNMFTVMFAIGRLPGLDRALARDAQRSSNAHREAAPGVHRSNPTDVRAGKRTAVGERTPLRGGRHAGSRLPFDAVVNRGLRR